MQQRTDAGTHRGAASGNARAGRGTGADGHAGPCSHARTQTCVIA